MINGILEALGLAKVKHVAPTPRFTAPRLIPNLQTLQAVITHQKSSGGFAFSSLSDA